MVHDEGEFWTKRDVKALAEEVGNWDQMADQKRDCCRIRNFIAASHPCVERDSPHKGIYGFQNHFRGGWPFLQAVLGGRIGTAS